jgi:hypothetical protein
VIRHKIVAEIENTMLGVLEERVAKVFISFIHEEASVATAVQKLIQKKLGQKAFLSSDQWQIYAGEVWLDRIHAELASAKVVVLLLSPTSIGRPWVNFEAGAAWLTAEKAIIPVCYGGLTKDTLPKPYSGIQALNLKEEGYYLVKSIAYHLGVPIPPPAGYKDYGPGSDLHYTLDALEKDDSLAMHEKL